MNEIIRLNYSAADTNLSNISDVNSSFAVGRLKVMYSGKNRNKSEIDESAIASAIPSIYNIPIVANYSIEENQIGGHDMSVESDAEGNLKLVNLTVPCGVVPEHARVYMERSADENGVEHDYLVADGVILWKRQEVYNHIVNDLGGKVAHSMEIEVLDGARDKDTKYYNISKFEFRALCLLGNCEPCFEGSQLELFSASDFKEQVEQMMAEIKENYSLFINAPNCADDTNSNREGGGKMNEEKIALANEFGIDVSTLDYSIDDFSVEELREKFAQMASDSTGVTEPAASEQTNDESSTSTEEPENTESTGKFELASNIWKFVNDAVVAETVTASWGDTIPRYYLCDIDEAKSEAYVCDYIDGKLYGVTYEMNGDVVTMQYDTKHRVKQAYAAFEGDDDTRGDIVNKMYQLAIDFGKKFADAESKYGLVLSELDELRKFKADVEKASADEERSAVLSQFSDLVGNELFDALVEKAESYDVAALEEKCYAIRGRLSSQKKFSMSNKATKIAVEPENENDNDAPYGGIVEKFAVKK